jgi:hypothetical protein
MRSSKTPFKYFLKPNLKITKNLKEKYHDIIGYNNSLYPELAPIPCLPTPTTPGPDKGPPPKQIGGARPKNRKRPGLDLKISIFFYDGF